MGQGFSRIGSVAILEGDDLTVRSENTGFGMDYQTLAATTRRFIAAFGDDYDQIAIFLAFTDRLNAQALAYAQPIRNQIKGLGQRLFEPTEDFGSPGRLESVLNMKRISLYGRDAANDPENDLYSVWAQETAHRWLVYFRFQREGDAAASDSLLGRQQAHWSNRVQADGSVMDGYTWKDNGDGTFSVVDRNRRFGALDQYGMGLRSAAEVPPFFLLDNLLDDHDQTIAVTTVLTRNKPYRAKRIDLTINDIIRAVGKRDPVKDTVATDLRMGVMLLGAPGVSAQTLVGEAFRIETTRRPWGDFYSTATGGRGRVCTELLHPCSGEAFEAGVPEWVESGGARDGVVAPGESFTLRIPLVNVGSEAGKATVQLDTRAALDIPKLQVETGSVAPQKMATVSFQGQVPYGTPCGTPLTLEWEAPGRLGPSRGTVSLTAGLGPVRVDTLESVDPGHPWVVNPAGTDNATAGLWERGTPEHTVAFDFTLQPGGAYSGQNAYVTGAAQGADTYANNLSTGATTLQSPEFSLTGLRGPWLVYQAYFVAADFNNEVLIPGAGDALVVQASTDGMTWTEVDRLTGLGTGWSRQQVRLGDKLPPEALALAAVRFRFVASASDGRHAVEAAIDDVGLWDEAPSCGQAAPPVTAGKIGSSGCALSPVAPPPRLPLVLAVLAVVIWRRRR